MDNGSGRERLVVDGFWGAVPLYVIKDHRLRAGHLRVLTAILSCPSPHFPSRQEISTGCGHTPRYCGKMICEMVELGVLKRRTRRGHSSVYELDSRHHSGVQGRHYSGAP